MRALVPGYERTNTVEYSHPDNQLVYILQCPTMYGP